MPTTFSKMKLAFLRENVNLVEIKPDAKKNRSGNQMGKLCFGDISDASKGAGTLFKAIDTDVKIDKTDPKLF